MNEKNNMMTLATGQTMMMTGGQTMAMATVDPAIVAAAETSKQRIQAAYIMAFQKRRDIEEVRANALKLCAIPKFAEQFVTYKPMGKGKVAVDSIRAMEGLASVYGNIQSDFQVTIDNEIEYRAKIYVTDLETNITYSDEINLKKTVERKSSFDRQVVGERVNSKGEVVYIVVATEDEMIVKINSAKSKALRNCLHRMIQPWLIEECREKAMETIRRGIKENPDAEKRKILDAFTNIGVTPTDLAKYLGHPVSSLTEAELINLRETYSSVRSGETSFWEFLKAKEEAEAEEDGKGKKGKLFGKDKKEPKSEPVDVGMSDLDLLAMLIEEKNIPTTAEQVKEYIESKGDIFNYEMVAPIINSIVTKMLAEQGE